MATQRSGIIHKRISNAWLDANGNDKNAVTDCEQALEDGAVVDERSYTDVKMMPMGVTFSQDKDGGTTSAQIRGILMDENSSQADDYILAVNVIHPISFKRIYAQGTTARHIKILGERNR